MVDQYNQKLYHVAADGQGREDSAATAGNYAHVKLIILTGSKNIRRGEELGSTRRGGRGGSRSPRLPGLELLEGDQEGGGIPG